MTGSSILWSAAFAGALALAAAPAVAAQANARGFDLRAGQEVTFAVTVGADGAVVVGAPRPSRFGAAQPRAGEITIGLSPKDKTLYEQVAVAEKTTAPIDFVATGWVGEIKIDERVLCGRLDAPVSQHIGATSWRVTIHDFTVGKAGETCE